MADYLVKLGQGEYAKRYMKAAPIAEVPGYVLDALVKLTASASHCQAMASAAGCSLNISTRREALDDLTRCAEYAEIVIAQCQAAAKLIEEQGAA